VIPTSELPFSHRYKRWYALAPWHELPRDVLWMSLRYHRENGGLTFGITPFHSKMSTRSASTLEGWPIRPGLDSRGCVWLISVAHGCTYNLHTNWEITKSLQQERKRLCTENKCFYLTPCTTTFCLQTTQPKIGPIMVNKDARA